MNGLDTASRSPLSRAIPSRRIPVHDPSHMPVDYSTTPGGTIYSTTPGGRFLLPIPAIYAKLVYLNDEQSWLFSPLDLIAWRFVLSKLEILAVIDL